MTVTTRSAFVTGAATGIGKGLVEKLDREGWQVFAGYNQTSPDALIAACGPGLRTMRCTISDPDSVKETARQLEKELEGAPLGALRRGDPRA